jgi:hypothetical protein
MISNFVLKLLQRLFKCLPCLDFVMTVLTITIIGLDLMRLCIHFAGDV